MVVSGNENSSGIINSCSNNSGLRSLGFWPNTVMVPFFGNNAPQMVLSKVDFPAPFLPNNP